MRLASVLILGLTLTACDRIELWRLGVPDTAENRAALALLTGEERSAARSREILEAMLADARAANRCIASYRTRNGASDAKNAMAQGDYRLAAEIGGTFTVGSYAFGYKDCHGGLDGPFHDISSESHIIGDVPVYSDALHISKDCSSILTRYGTDFNRTIYAIKPSAFDAACRHRSGS